MYRPLMQRLSGIRIKGRAQQMLLRGYQEKFVEGCLAALRGCGNTLGVAPTGSGKTVMFAAIVGRLLKDLPGKVLILAHRDELIAQNRFTFKRMHPTIPTSVVDHIHKNWEGRVVFGMVPTLSRKRHLSAIPSIDILVIDEAHHATTASYQRILKAARDLNPSLKVLGVTATPIRADKKSLRAVFNNCGAQLTMGELIKEGALVKPRTFVMDVGVQDELNNVRKIGAEYDMEAVAQIMDRTPISEAVIRRWKEKAGNRQTIVFCSTIKHAQHTTEAYQSAGIKAAYITGKTPHHARQEILTALKYQDIQVLVNVGVATEGFDEPSLSCVVLLRPSSQKNTLIQMVGRGLRPYSNEKRGIVKDDCVILDFGTSILTHGDLEQEEVLPELASVMPGEAPVKACPTCQANVPISTMTCPFCGHQFKHLKKEALSDFNLKEIDVINRSIFVWEDLFNQNNAYIATGLKAWCGVFLKANTWHAIGGIKQNITLITQGSQEHAFAQAEAWLKKHGGSKRKAAEMQRVPATEKQRRVLPATLKNQTTLTCYQASCWLNYHWHHKKIVRLIAKEVA